MCKDDVIVWALVIFASLVLGRCVELFFLMIRRPPRSTLDRSSAASDVYKRQGAGLAAGEEVGQSGRHLGLPPVLQRQQGHAGAGHDPVSYTHLRAHETVLDLVCRLLLEKKKKEQ